MLHADSINEALQGEFGSVAFSSRRCEDRTLHSPLLPPIALDPASGRIATPRRIRERVVNAGWKQFARVLLIGAAMGAADVIPGVSGGTIALIAGIYHRLIEAISRYNSELLGLIGRKQIGRAWRHVDATFLATLGAGLATGFAGMMVLMTRLLGTEATRPLTFAVFFGLIVASAITLARSIRNRTPGEHLTRGSLGLVGVVVAAGIAFLPTSHVEPSLPYVFLCGAVAIIAMILPGISGAMILLLLGTYEYLAATPSRILAGEEIPYNLTVIAVFAVAAAVGLGSFSRVLKWLLTHRPDATLAILTGFMFGSLVKLWPFQRDTTPDVAEFRKKVFEPMMPGTLDTSVLLVLTVIAATIAIVLTFEAIRHRRRKTGAAQVAAGASPTRNAA